MDARTCGIATVLALLALAQAPAPGAEPAGEKYALLVGVSKYSKNELRDLPYPAEDVEELAQILLANGYRPENVTVMTQKRGSEEARLLPSAENIRRELALLLRDREEGDTVVIGLAGHGVQIVGVDDSFFCPFDTRLGDEKTLLSIGEVYRQMEKSRAALKVLMVDACRNSPQSDNSRARAVVDLASETRPQKEPPGGVVALFSCSASEKAYEHEDLKHGVFFHFVIEGLRGQAAGSEDQGIMVEDLARYVKRRVSDFVRAKYGERQMPELKGNLRGLVPLVTLDAALAKTIADLSDKIRANPKDSAALNNRGNAYRRKGDFARAIADYDASLAIDPSWAQGYLNRATAHQGKREVDLAIADCTAAIRLDPKNAGAYTLRGNFYNNEKGDSHKAFADFSSAARLTPKDSIAWSNLGFSLRKLGRLDEALADYNEAIRLDPENALAFGNRATLYFDDRKDYSRALADYSQVIRLNPRSASAYRLRGAAHEARGDQDAALADFNEAIRRNPGDVDAIVKRGAIYIDFKGNPAKALADYTEAIRLRPGYAHAYHVRGFTRSRLGDSDGALADYSEALRLEPGNAIARKNRGVAFRDSGKTAEALADFDEAIRLDPRFADAFRDRGLLHYTLSKDFDRALADFSQAIRLDPRDASSLVNRGLAHAFNEDRAKRDYPRALADFGEAIRLDPSYVVAYRSRGIVRAELKDYDGAIADFTEVLRLDPKDVNALLDRGRAYLIARDDFARCLADDEEAIRLDPKNARAYRCRAYAMFRLGKNAEAIPDYEESIRLDPSEGDAYTNRLNIFRVDGDAGRVVALYTEAIRLDPKNAVAHTIRGIARRRLGEFDAALADLAEGYRLDPKSAVTCNGLAWFRATCTAAKFRDGRAAVEAATRASELTRGEDADVLDTLAAAHAEAGDFARAVEMETKAMATPENFSLGEIDNCRARLKLYEAHKPYRE